ACAFGLMSKPMLVTLPFVLLLLDYWPLGRSSHRPAPHSLANALEGRGHVALSAMRSWVSLLAEKIPLIALAVASSAVTLVAQKGAVGYTEQLPIVSRLNNAVVTYVLYIWQMFWPAKLAVFYPHPENLLPLWQIIVGLVILAGITTGSIAVRKQRPYLLVGWLWYIGMLVPVIGLVQVGWQGHADRYTYLPQIGLYIMISWMVFDFTALWHRQREILTACAAIVITAL